MKKSTWLSNISTLLFEVGAAGILLSISFIPLVGPIAALPITLGACMCVAGVALSLTGYCKDDEALPKDTPSHNNSYHLINRRTKEAPRNKNALSVNKQASHEIKIPQSIKNDSNSSISCPSWLSHQAQPLQSQNDIELPKSPKANTL